MGIVHARHKRFARVVITDPQWSLNAMSARSSILIKMAAAAAERLGTTAALGAAWQAPYYRLHV